MCRRATVAAVSLLSCPRYRGDKPSFGIDSTDRPRTVFDNEDVILTIHCNVEWVANTCTRGRSAIAGRGFTSIACNGCHNTRFPVDAPNTVIMVIRDVHVSITVQGKGVRRMKRCLKRRSAVS